MRPGDFPRWNMNYHFVRGQRRLRFFPRLFWFAMGAGAYAFWTRHRETERRVTDIHNGEWKHWSGNHFGCHRRREQLPPAREWTAQTSEPVSTAPATAATPVVAPAPILSTTPAYPSGQPDTRSSEWQAERFREAGKQASGTMAEMSENALDALMANIQALKTKLTQAREEREKERLYLEQRIPTDSPDGKDNARRLD